VAGARQRPQKKRLPWAALFPDRFSLNRACAGTFPSRLEQIGALLVRRQTRSSIRSGCALEHDAEKAAFGLDRGLTLRFHNAMTVQPKAIVR
jgi:hypothetical protein